MRRETVDTMLLTTQGLAEYVGITLRGLTHDAGALIGKARHLGSENFGIVLGGLLVLVLGLMLTSSSKRR